MRSLARVLAVATAALAVSVSARAVDSLTGTYVEKVKCDTLLNGVRSKVKAKDQLWFLDDIGDGNVYLHISGGSGWKYHGWLETDSSKPDQGFLGLVACGPSDALPQGEFRVLRVKTNGKLKVVLRGSGLGIRNFGASICSHTFTRISLDLPAVNSTCP
jgi:hypothetical protein